MEFSLAYWLLYCCFVLFNHSFAYNIHLRDTVPSGAVLFNASIGEDWSYDLEKSLSTNQGKHLLKIDEHGVVTMRKAVNCTRLVKNPFSVYIEASKRTRSNSTSSNYTLTPLTVTFHGPKCYVKSLKHTRRKSLEILSLSSLPVRGMDLQLVVVNDFKHSACFTQGQKLFALHDFLPRTLVSCDLIYNLRDSSESFYLDPTTSNIYALQSTCLQDHEIDLQISVRIEEFCFKNKLGVIEYAPEIPIELILQRTTDHSGAIINKSSLQEPQSTTHRRLRRATRTSNHAPSFAFPEYIVTVPENQDRGYVVTTLQAVDQDSESAGTLTYQMVADRDGRSQSMFEMDSATGLVTTKSVLDRENMDVHFFRITATDGGIPERSDTTILQINVEDLNDHPPIFENAAYQLPIRENVDPGTTIIEIRATDDDIGSNSDIRYSIINPDAPNDVFRIDQGTGVITTRSRLDRETVVQYIIEVLAVDLGSNPGPQSASTEVTVDILDENDNYPQFSQRTYEVIIPESISPNVVIESIIATDRDEGTNAEIRYSMVGGHSQGHFAIDSFSGQITVISRIDYEITSNYRLVIRAQDSGRPPKSNSTNVVINVEDVNDNEPRFPSTLYQTSVREDLRIGSSIINLQAFDEDSGLFSQLTYSISNAPTGNPFSINENSGMIVTTRELDRETTSRYDFVAVAQDQGDPPKSATTQISITILDVNDNPPTFTQSEYNVVVEEDARPGTSVATVTATDADEESSVSYQITAGNTRNRFSIISQMGLGVISVALPLDYKQEQRFVLTVTASDNALSDNCLVYINISDANTYRPVFEQSPYSVSVDEDVPTGSTVVVVHATDGDVGENARITYSMDNIPEFEIDEDTGAILTKMELDRETKLSYTLHVTAQDNGLKPQLDTTDVEITVIDVNDNYPVFKESSYRGEIREDVSKGTSVIRISAEDADEGLNKRIRYTFSGGDDGNGAFIIDSNSGLIRTDARLDREEVAVYNLEAYATDRGTPQRRTSVNIEITVKDVNDNSPKFRSAVINVEINENSPIGSLVDTIVATDPDEGMNAVVAFSIVGGDEQFFALDYQSGQLTTSAEMNYEERNEYEVIVRATSTPLFNDAVIKIHVIDQNDNIPIINDFAIVFNNFEDYFPTGEIGSVPAHDPDVMDQLKYSIIRGNDASLIHINSSTGGIKLSQQLDTNVNTNGDMEVSVTDGVNEVYAEMILNVTMVTEDMLYNSVTVRLADITQEEFLSPMFGRFVEALAQIIPCDKKHVYLFNVQDDDVDHGHILNISFSASRSDGTYYSSKYLQQRVYLNRATLTTISMSSVLPFDDNLCLVEPCANYEECLSILAFGETSGFVRSQTILFRPVHPVNQYRCVCPLGFTGNFCITEINECYSNPCQNNGKCVRAEGGYSCLCPEDYAGVNCEISLTEGRCSEGGSICRNGGSCMNYMVGGFNCFCPPGEEYDGKFCEVTTRHFPAGSFVTFSALLNRIRLTIALSFATLSKNALLFYNGRYNERHDFIALEIINGQLQFSFSTGGTTARVTASIAGGVSDGMWHAVTVDYHARSATLTIDDCDTAMAVQFGNVIGNYTCANKVVLQGTDFRFLDLTGPFMLGGLATLPEDFPVKNRDYIGCIKDVYIDHRLLDLASFVANNGTVSGCDAKRDFCQSNPCENGGTCTSEWNRYSCTCRNNWGGSNCQEAKPGDMRFYGDGYVKFPGSTTAIQLPWRNSLMFRTRQENGFLMMVAPGSFAAAHLEIVDGYVMYSFSNIVVQISSVRVDDGEWHDVQAEWKNDQIVLSLDNEKYVESANEVGNFIAGLKINEVVVGGLPIEGGVESAFIGCVQGVKVGVDAMIGDRNDEIISDVWVGTARDKCNVEDLCENNPCPEKSDCINDWGRYHCECHPGYYGNDCKHACDEELDPCQHFSECQPLKSSSHGYSCECSELYYGQYCENRVDDQPCTNGWWGYPICGPCTCDVDKGYDDTCNKTTGDCYCEAHSYKPADSDTCYPCDCYDIGSYSRDCDQESGQCQCKRGVIGKRCDSCRDPFAEVTLRGCEVIYKACPRNYAGGKWWQQTMFSKTAKESCPYGSFGMATRHCTKESGWLEPDMFNCTSDTFSALATMLRELESGEKKLNTRFAKEISEELQFATSETPEFYGNDVNVAYKIMSIVLDYESQLGGFNLTATQDFMFTKNMLESASSILDLDNADYWMVIQQSSGGTAELTGKLEAYGHNLARNLESTFTEPFALVTPNIIFNLDLVIRENFKGANIPQYDNGLFHEEVQDSTTVKLPSDILAPRTNQLLDTVDIENNVGVTSWFMFPTLGPMLPKSYDTDTVKIHDKLALNTPVVSLTLYDGKADGQLPNPLPSPIIVDFELKESINRSDPQCVYWDYGMENNVGGWSTKGCTLQLHNKSSNRVECACTHMTQFAVLMDVSPTPVALTDKMALQLITYIGISISLLALLLSFITFVCLPNLRSNSNSIHINLVISLFIAELVFLLGIDASLNFVCKVVAIALHYFFMATFSWMFVEGLHLYRMLTEVKNINRGQMKFYYVVGYGLPLVIVSLAVGLSQDKYGKQINQNGEHFCWLSTKDNLIWSFAGPVLAVVGMNLIVFIMAVKATVQSKSKDPEFSTLKSGLKASAVLLPLLGTTWVFGILAVNQDVGMFHYLFAIFNCLQGLFIFMFHCVFNEKVRLGWRQKWARMRGKKGPLDATYATETTFMRSALAYSSRDGTPARFNIGTSTGSTGSSRTTSKTSTSNLYRPDGYLRNTSTSTTSPPSVVPEFATAPAYRGYNFSNIKPNPDDPDTGEADPKNVRLLAWYYANKLGRGDGSRRGAHDSDSESDLSVGREPDNMSLASSHSSDEDDDGSRVKNTTGQDWQKMPNKANERMNAVKNIYPSMHSTPKDDDDDDWCFRPVDWNFNPGVSTPPTENGIKKNPWPGEPFSTTASESESRTTPRPGILKHRDVRKEINGVKGSRELNDLNRTRNTNISASNLSTSNLSNSSIPIHKVNGGNRNIIPLPVPERVDSLPPAYNDIHNYKYGGGQNQSHSSLASSSTSIPQSSNLSKLPVSGLVPSSDRIAVQVLRPNGNLSDSENSSNETSV
ncbi:cadherin EGF LAG seven-pass G-type receptor 2 [Saccoglossus kowalevskii]|uniref:Cadherin EGF LAG seven-pass G-type receptor 2 n=1 Tax=Saccoglossus kowalevskii TaxID=10224 RepID=A0ABM0MWZ0_SACKO|nr:PREDICTED: cadherin EGF LAG seven-pass G-type receptor 2 [Saccoglossus kowalevskii]